MSDQTPKNPQNTPSTNPNDEIELGNGLTGLSSAWPMYVGDYLNEKENTAEQGPEAAAG